jgi:hypothetical protein
MRKELIRYFQIKDKNNGGENIDIPGFMNREITGRGAGIFIPGGSDERIY